MINKRKKMYKENEMDWSNTSKLLSNIENLWLMVEKWFLGFKNL